MRKLLPLLILFISFIHCRAQEKRFYKDIKKFQNQDIINAPQKGIILFIGSSTFTRWGDNLRKDFGNDKIVNRAFGASTLLDLIGYENEILFAYQPQKIIIYCGENDIANEFPKVKGKEVAKRFQKLYQDIRYKFPNTPVVYMSVKPSPLRWKMRNEMRNANEHIASYLRKQPNGDFVNIWNSLLDKYGKPNTSLHLEDELHLNKKGYDILTGLEQYVNTDLLK